MTLRKPGEYMFPGRRGPDRPLTTRQYARLVSEWGRGIGLNRLKYATHSMRRTKTTLIYRRTGNLRAVQLLLGHARIEIPCAILALRSTMPAILRRGSRSQLPGQSCRALHAGGYGQKVTRADLVLRIYPSGFVKR